MATKPTSVEIVLKEGPVIIPSLNRAGVDVQYDLWNGIVASEFYPAGVDSAFYVLSIWKPVVEANEVWLTEAALVRALELLATAWPFSGGSFMVLEKRELNRSPRYESNAKEIESELLARLGLKSVVSSVSIPISASASYHEPPLRKASQVATAILGDPPMRNLLGYHQNSWVEYYAYRRTGRSSWFIDLYKMREVLKKIYRGEHQARAQLGISRDDWSYFGAILNNNDLRHAEITDNAPQVSGQHVARLFELARNWTLSHLRSRGLPVI